MSLHAESIRLHLSGGLCSARQLIEKLNISQPTISRALADLGDQVVRLGAARSIQYALRDAARGLPDMAVHQVDMQGRVRQIGTLIPVCPEGFVMRQGNGMMQHSDGLPWWLYDMRPQGYLGRAYAARHGAALGLPERLAEWNDSHVLRALLSHGQDVVGNLLLGDAARAQFLAAPVATPVPGAAVRKAASYARLAQVAAQGEAPGSSAGGEQPKFTAYAMTPDGLHHVLVKFSEREESPVSQRWRDLLLAEHLALETLRAADIPAAKTRIFDHESQRFLEVERFDRVGALGRRALISLTALDAEFVGAGDAIWPVVTARLVAAGQIRSSAAMGASLLWAFGSLIGNTDMHGGNLSFIAEDERFYALAPAYDMTPMAFAPRSGGGLPDTLTAVSLHASVPHTTWRQAAMLADDFLERLKKATPKFSVRFIPCIAALERHIEAAAESIMRLG